MELAEHLSLFHNEFNKFNIKFRSMNVRFFLSYYSKKNFVIMILACKSQNLAINVLFYYDRHYITLQCQNGISSTF